MILILGNYEGPNSLFIRVLVDKKYALPYKVVDALVFHFIRLSNTYKAKKGESEKLPVLWHQSLLVFAQRFVLASIHSLMRSDFEVQLIALTPTATLRI